MENYKNLNGNSGITAYEIGADFIVVRFKDKDGLEDYTYTNRVTGMSKLATMKRLAKGGKGLATYINKDVGKAWASKKRVVA